ncbi:MAG: S46 family peptidase, partial [Elusimicrobia bacterium]|nr:S46 family peptidase [Elusimicrobiota bacterium]
ARIEKESSDKTGLRCDVVELYQGGEYWLYRYKKYTDLRLVMAPEAQAAFYGGDPDNFTFPRFDLDFAFFRVYENGKPVHPKSYFRWSRAGAKEGELVFVSGNPGSTDRLKTVSQLEYERNYHLPDDLAILRHRRLALLAYSAKGTEEARRAKNLLFGIDNAIKAISGELAGLRDGTLMARKLKQEKAFRAQAAARADLRRYGDAWDKIAAVQDKLAARHKQLMFRNLFGSRLAGLATTIVRYVVEVKKPNDKRYKEFRDSALDSLNFRLFSPAPVYKDLEEAALADCLRQSLEELGPDDAHVRAALGGETPQEKAHELVSGTRLDQPAARKALITGGIKAVEASKDPLIVWARAIDPAYRKLRKWSEDEIESVETAEGRRLAKARFALYGKSLYPDATFTPRLSFGRVAGYEQGTTRIPYKTTFYGLYDRAASFDDRPPFDLPARVARERGDRALLATPLNFVTTNDIIGGNSGSPVFNRHLEYVGLIFDGDIQSLVGRYIYDDAQNRAVAVHSSAILAALRRIYHCDALARELTGR